jgi:hypothetical protein
MREVGGAMLMAIAGMLAPVSVSAGAIDMLGAGGALYDVPVTSVSTSAAARPRWRRC